MKEAIRMILVIVVIVLISTGVFYWLFIDNHTKYTEENAIDISHYPVVCEVVDIARNNVVLKYDDGREITLYDDESVDICKNHKGKKVLLQIKILTFEDGIKTHIPDKVLAVLPHQ